MNAQTGSPQLSWVLPLYRTAAQLEELVQRVDAVSAGLAIAHEIVLVDDACPEGSGEIAAEMAARNPVIRLFSLDRNGGQEAALRAGLAVSRGAWCVVLDADLQDPPEGMLALWPVRDAMDVVFAQRTGRYTTHGRRITSAVYRRAAALLGGLPPGAGLYALMRGPMVRRLIADPSAPKTLLALLARAGLRARSVPVPRAPRAQGESAYSSRRRTAKALLSLWELSTARLARFTTGTYPDTSRENP